MAWAGLGQKRLVRERFGNEVGFVRATNYGKIFDVIDLGAANKNLANTNVRIRSHTDNPYRDPFPGLHSHEHMLDYYLVEIHQILSGNSSLPRTYAHG